MRFPLILALTLAPAALQAGEIPRVKGPKEYGAMLTQAAKAQGIEILWDGFRLPIYVTGGGAVNGKKIQDWDLAASTQMLNELQLYPRSFMDQLSLDRIVLVRQLNYNGTRVYGLAVPRDKSFYIDLEMLLQDPNGFPKVFHHELFHMAPINHRKWMELNKSGFVYGAGGIMERGSYAGVLNHSLKGFLNRYSMASPQEDQAEIFSHLIMNRSQVAAKAKGDPVLTRKLEYMAAHVRSLSSEMDATFWKHVSSISRAQ